jgi:DNA-directed RNA polymerase specialized sigma24 family protein
LLQRVLDPAPLRPVLLMDIPFSQPTQWTLITRAQGDGTQARAALSQLVHRYQGTILHHVRSQYLPAGLEAEDVRQSFLENFRSDSLVTLDPTRGRFRGWLKTAVLRHTWRMRRTHQTQKQGNALTIPDDEVITGHDETPESLVLVVEALDTCDEALRRYLEHAKNGGRLTALQSELPGRQFSPNERAELAVKLGFDLTQQGWAALLSVTVSRAQKRYRKFLCEVVAETLGFDANDPFPPRDDPESHPRVRRELNMLWQALCRPPAGFDQPALNEEFASRCMD